MLPQWPSGLQQLKIDVMAFYDFPGTTLRERIRVFERVTKNAGASPRFGMRRKVNHTWIDSKGNQIPTAGMLLNVSANHINATPVTPGNQYFGIPITWNGASFTGSAQMQ